MRTLLLFRGARCRARHTQLERIANAARSATRLWASHREEDYNMLGNMELVSRLVMAAALGSVIGFERERLSWAAGLRTHMLVCVGSALIMIVSAFGFADALKAEHVVLDPSRVAAQVVSGIGFHGAGSI